MRNLAVLASLVTIAACTTEAEVGSFEDSDSTDGTSIHITPDLSGCHGKASSDIPSDGQYVITTFGGGADNQRMSCGGYADGTGWYAASRQRYGCGAHLQITANNQCVVVSAMDYGPDVCVEAAAHSPILDMSPRAAKALYGVSGAGWSDHMIVNVEEVSSATPLGPCTATGGGTGSGGGSGSGDGGTTTAASCTSSTLDRDVSDGTCVQSAGDSAWYECQSGAWVAKSGTSGCADTYAFCESATLGTAVAPRTCVQSGSTGKWFQCNGQTWVSPGDVAGQTGPIGTCSEMHPTH